MDFANPAKPEADYVDFLTDDNLIDRVANVETVLTEFEVVIALMAIIGPGSSTASSQRVISNSTTQRPSSPSSGSLYYGPSPR